MANFTGEGNYTSKLHQALNAPPAGIVEFFSALNIFLSITAAVGNALILYALKNVSSIHAQTKLFFRCLAVTDLCVGLIVQPLYATYSMSRIIKMNMNVLYYVDYVNIVLSYILCGVSFLTSTAISVDRLFALLLGLRYRHVATLRRVRVVITCFWLIAASFGFLRVWREDIAYKEASVILPLCLATSIFCYTTIHLKLRRHQQALIENSVPHGQQKGEGIPLNIARYKKTVSTIMWVQLALVACYVPWGIETVLYANGIEHIVARLATDTLIYFNSTLNPILYCWRIREVKQAVKSTIRQFSCF
ncbi:adenosine receptor A3-like [Oculina patagonica]